VPLYDAELRAWVLYRYQGFVVVVGNVYADKKGRFPDGRMIQTSPLLSVGTPRDGNIVATLNSRYLLVGPESRGTDLRNAELPPPAFEEPRFQVPELEEQP
jgi:hypothetical protein